MLNCNTSSSVVTSSHMTRVGSSQFFWKFEKTQRKKRIRSKVTFAYVTLELKARNADLPSPPGYEQFTHNH